ncbi:MAG: MFS transporter [Planctomycetes bacterium]|nr:MFS transporter [Planctomycetota bacterium]
MRRNFTAVLSTSVLFGLTFGMYELVLPFYLKDQGVSNVGQGYIFAAGLLMPFFLRIGVGGISDRFGRKIFYGLSILLAGVASLLTPFFANSIVQAALKGARESAVETRKVLHPILLYEFAKSRFVDFWGKTQGFERLFEAAGYPLAGFLLTAGGAAGYRNAMLLAAFLLGLSFVGFALLYKEGKPSGNDETNAPRPPRLRELVSLRLNRKLWIIIISTMIFNVGLMCSHCFVMPLFFTQKFGLTKEQTAIVLMLHRLFMAVPLIFAGWIIRGGLKVQKVYYILFIFVEGVLITAGGLLPNFYSATSVWLFHDFFGAGLWQPAQAALIMHYASDHRRGLDVGKVIAFSAVTLFLGPLLAGYLTALPGLSAAAAISLPFIVGGAIIAASAFLLLLL